MKSTPRRMHYVVERCIFHDCFTAYAVPYLTRSICDYDREYHAQVFPEFVFSRNGSWHYTLGHGANCCHYVWARRD